MTGGYLGSGNAPAQIISATRPGSDDAPLTLADVLGRPEGFPARCHPSTPAPAETPPPPSTPGTEQPEPEAVRIETEPGVRQDARPVRVRVEVRRKPSPDRVRRLEAIGS